MTAPGRSMMEEVVLAVMIDGVFEMMMMLEETMFRQATGCLTLLWLDYFLCLAPSLALTRVVSGQFLGRHV